MAERREVEGTKLHVVSPEGPLYRIARRPNPWAWPDWANVGSDGTFGSRWDDPEGLYRVLYASSSRLGAFIEVLARFRPDPHVQEALDDIQGDESPSQLPGELDGVWLEKRCIGVAHVEGAFADVGHSSWLTELRDTLAPRILHHRLDDLDAATVRLSAPRRFTQEISREIYNRSTPSRQRRFTGIAYRSRLGDEFQNWAIFETPRGVPWAETPSSEPLSADDPDLRHALDHLGVRLITR